MACLIPLSLNTDCQSRRYISVYFPKRQDSLRHSKVALPRSPSRRLQPVPEQQDAPPNSHPQQQQEQQQQQQDDVAGGKSTLTMQSCPLSSAEWKAALGDIKREYMSRRFKECLMRCNALLDLGAALDHAHPIHLVYLRFYTASALEMQARVLHRSTPCRRSALLKQAQDHFATASLLADKVEQDMSRPSSRTASVFSCMHSPSVSTDSASTMSTRASCSSPSSSWFDQDHCPIQSAPVPPRKKRVAFSDKTSLKTSIEPFIRPDSPTLGFDEWLGRSSPEPLSPGSILKNPSRETPRPASIQTTLDEGKELLSPLPSEPDTITECDPFYHARSVHRFCTILNGVRRQITSHMAVLDAEIAACQTPTTPLPTMTPEMRASDLRARIERLRANGWRRPRFNAERYEALRENALADLME